MTAIEIIRAERRRASRDGVTISQAAEPRDTFLAGYLSACVELEGQVRRVDSLASSTGGEHGT